MNGSTEFLQLSYRKCRKRYRKDARQIVPYTVLGHSSKSSPLSKVSAVESLADPTKFKKKTQLANNEPLSRKISYRRIDWSLDPYICINSFADDSLKGTAGIRSPCFGFCLIYWIIQVQILLPADGFL